MSFFLWFGFEEMLQCISTPYDEWYWDLLEHNLLLLYWNTIYVLNCCPRLLCRISFVLEGFQKEAPQISVIKNLCQTQWLDFKHGIHLAKAAPIDLSFSDNIWHLHFARYYFKCFMLLIVLGKITHLILFWDLKSWYVFPVHHFLM